MNTSSSAAEPVLQAVEPADFDDWWALEGEWVEEANQRRGGSSGVQLLPAAVAGGPQRYSKRQLGHLYRSLRHPWGRPTVLREVQAYVALAALGIRVPTLLFGAARREEGQWQALLVTEDLTGFVSLDVWYRSQPDEAARGAVMEAAGAMLARLHAARWQHGCCYPKHIFVRTLAADESAAGDSVQAEAALLDLEKCRRRLRATTAAKRDLAQLGRHWDDMPVADLARLRASHARHFGR